MRDFDLDQTAVCGDRAATTERGINAPGSNRTRKRPLLRVKRTFAGALQCLRPKLMTQSGHAATLQDKLEAPLSLSKCVAKSRMMETETAAKTDLKLPVRVVRANELVKMTPAESAFGRDRTSRSCRTMIAFGVTRTVTVRHAADAARRWADTRPQSAELVADRGSLAALPRAACRL
jgi:hypothetical protein